MNAPVVETRTTREVHSRNGGAIPAPALHFRTGRRAEAEQMVLDHHYSRRVPGANTLIFTGSLHLDGGLFGGDGPMVAAALFSCGPSRWGEPVLELARLVRANNRVPLSFLVARCVSALRKAGHDLLVSFADRGQGHEGFVYRASNWHYAGCRDRSIDGVLIDGRFFPGRSCNSAFGTRSPDRLREIFADKIVAPHYDEGKHLYWMALGSRGKAKAVRLGFIS